MKKKSARSLALLTAAAMTATTFFGTGIPAVQAADEWIGDEDLKDNSTDAPEKDTVLPSTNQYNYQKEELAAFCHFGPNTFNEIEWGEHYGDKKPNEIFRLTEDFDAKTLVNAVKDAGFHKLIVTAKHHDGFCIWDSKWTTYDVAPENYPESPDVKRDVLAEISAACTEADIDMGLYLSPWDIHDDSYGYYDAEGNALVGKDGQPLNGKTWEEVFGKGDRTDEIFMAWNYASYMNAVAAAGKAEYDIPMFVNAWIVQPEDTRPGNYPSGGPQAQNHDVWRAAAPDIDILCPDIYLPEFPDILRLYSRAGNPVFIPESRAGQNGAANAAFAIGEMGAIGYSPFGFENGALSEANRTFNSFYRKAGAAADIILEAQASGNIRAAWVKGSDPAVYKQTLELGDYKIGVELVSSGMRNGGAPQLTGGTYSPDASGYAIAIRESDDSFLFLGSNVRITFLPADGQGTIGLAKVTEGDFRNGEWVEGRWLNGDQIQLRYDVLYAVDEGYSGQGLNFGTPEPGFIKVQLYKY